MTEAEWRGCTDLSAMLQHLCARRGNERKLRLFACACCRAVWDLLTDEPSREALDVSERAAEGEVSKGRVRTVTKSARAAIYAALETARAAEAEQHTAALSLVNASDAVWRTLLTGKYFRAGLQWVCLRTSHEVGLPDLAEAQPRLLRDIFGVPYPFPQVTLKPEWLTGGDGAVRSVAQAAYDERALPSGHLDPARLAVLADALTDAGCDDAEVLGHLRSPGPHVRGCWALALVLGKE